ncbi:hypothetical protein CHH70_17335, partial [Shouchella clausii]
ASVRKSQKSGLTKVTIHLPSPYKSPLNLSKRGLLYYYLVYAITITTLGEYVDVVSIGIVKSF